MRTSSTSLLLRELAVLLRSGLPLTRALDLLSRREGNLAGGLREVKRRLEEGEDLSRAFRESGILPDFVCEMMVAARTGESLEGVLSRAADLLARLEEFRSRISGALVYPSLVMGFSVLSVMVVLEFIVPRLRRILLSFGRDLPLPTKILLWGAKLLWWTLVLGGPVAVLFLLWWVKRKGWEEVHRILLRIPVLGRLWLYLDLSRWSYTVALLLDSGVVLPRAVYGGNRSCQNLYLRRCLGATVQPLEEGRSLSGLLRRCGFVPDFLSELAAIGEESGTLPEMLRNASDLLLREADHLIERILRWIEPLTILLIGAVVAYIVLSVILPIMEISSSVRL